MQEQTRNRALLGDVRMHFFPMEQRLGLCSRKKEIRVHSLRQPGLGRDLVLRWEGVEVLFGQSVEEDMLRNFY